MNKAYLNCLTIENSSIWILVFLTCLISSLILSISQSSINYYYLALTVLGPTSPDLSRVFPNDSLIPKFVLRWLYLVNNKFWFFNYCLFRVSVFYCTVWFVLVQHWMCCCINLLLISLLVWPTTFRSSATANKCIIKIFVLFKILMYCIVLFQLSMYTASW